MLLTMVCRGCRRKFLWNKSKDKEAPAYCAKCQKTYRPTKVLPRLEQPTEPRSPNR